MLFLSDLFKFYQIIFCTSSGYCRLGR